MVYAKLYGVTYLKADETLLTSSVRHCTSLNHVHTDH